MTNLKSRIFNKRQQHSPYVNIRENLMERELLINLDFSENYSNRNQNEIQSAYFGNNSFSLFTACAFYNNQCKTEKVSVAITTEGSDKSKVASISSVDFLIQFLQPKIETDTTHIFSDGYAAQFRSIPFSVCLQKFQRMLTSYDIILRHTTLKVITRMKSMTTHAVIA